MLDLASRCRWRSSMDRGRRSRDRFSPRTPCRGDLIPAGSPAARRAVRSSEPPGPIMTGDAAVGRGRAATLVAGYNLLKRRASTRAWSMLPAVSRLRCAGRDRDRSALGHTDQAPAGGAWVCPRSLAATEQFVGRPLRPAAHARRSSCSCVHRAIDDRVARRSSRSNPDRGQRTVAPVRVRHEQARSPPGAGARRRPGRAGHEASVPRSVDPGSTVCAAVPVAAGARTASRSAVLVSTGCRSPGGELVTGPLRPWGQSPPPPRRACNPDRADIDGGREASCRGRGRIAEKSVGSAVRTIGS